MKKEKQHSDKCPAKKGQGACLCDGYHTFDELYWHRIALFIALCRKIHQKNERNVWRSKLHSDGSGKKGWFILGINKKRGEQITYHLPMKLWETTNFAETLAKAQKWDGHSSDDVLKRLKNI